MHAVTAQPGPLVEPVLRPAWLDELSGSLENCALGRGTTPRKAQQHGLADVRRPEAKSEAGPARVEATTLQRSGDDDSRPRGHSRARGEPARIDCVQSRATPEQPCEQETAADGADASASFDKHSSDHQDRNTQPEPERRRAHDVRRRKPQAQSRHGELGHPV